MTLPTYGFNFYGWELFHKILYYNVDFNCSRFFLYTKIKFAVFVFRTHPISKKIKFSFGV